MIPIGRKDRILLIILGCLAILFLIFYLKINNVSINIERRHFVELAESFVKGRLNILENSVTSKEYSNDLIFLSNKYYLPFGPLPAIILMPTVLFNNNLFNWAGTINWAIIIIIFLLVLKIFYRLKYTIPDSAFLAYAFLFSSPLIGVSWYFVDPYFAHVVACLLVLLAIHEYVGKKRYWLIGLFLGLVALTRLTVGLTIAFFLLEIAFAKYSWKEKILNTIRISAPFILCLGLLLVYNYLRFGSPWETGYSLQILTVQHLLNNRGYGLFSFKHIFGNIYYSLLAMPLPVFINNLSHVLKFPFITADPWGLSLFFTSPYLIYLFFLKYRDKISLFLIITILLIAAPIYLYYGVGFIQFGYRYALDFFPLLFFLIWKNYNDRYGALSNGVKTIIIISSLINFYLFFIFLNHFFQFFRY